MAQSIQYKPLLRYFNQLEDMGEFYKKTSVNKKKLIEEFNFMSNVPADLRKYYPEVSNLEINESHCSCLIKKIPAHDASHFLLNNRTDDCEKVLNKVFSYLTQLPHKKCSETEFRKNVFENIFQKNLARVKDIKNLSEQDLLDELARKHGFESVQDYCLLVNQELGTIFSDANKYSLIFSHGDLCFSNIILFNDQVHLIDPKGYSGDSLNTYRPIGYDLAKLSQCVFGNYDIINNEMFEIEQGEIRLHSQYLPTKMMVDTFQKMVEHFNVDLKTVRLIEASLFLSLIPHHRESRKRMMAFLANSISIFKSLK